MRSLQLLRVLRSTVAVGAIALGSASANAACTTANGVVTCTGPSTTNDVNGAFGRTPPPSVSLVVAEGATVTRGSNFGITPGNPPFSTAIGYTNQGTVGTTAANVDFSYFGTAANTANTFTLDNRGTQNGRITAINVGGAITATNSGTITRGIDLRATGPITFTSTGTVFNSDRFSSAAAITLVSSRTTQAAGSDGITRTTETGDRVVANISGPVAIPGAPPPAGSAPTGQDIFINGVGGAAVALNGPAGSVTVQSVGTNTESQFTQSNPPTGFAFASIDNRRTVGTDATATVGTSGRVGNLFVTSGAGAATAVVNGSVIPVANGFGLTQGLVRAISDGTVTTSRSSSTTPTGSFLSNTSGARTATNIGGVASAEVGTTGSVSGQVVAFSNNSAATVRIAGTVGTANSFFASATSVIADARGTDTTNQNSSSNSADGSNSSSTSTASASGDAATVAVAATGRLNTDASSLGDMSATLDNGGTIGGSVTVTSNRQLTTASANDQSRTATTSASRLRTQVDRLNTRSTDQAVGGTASLVNRAGASIGGTVNVSGLTSATLDNAGTIARAVDLRSTGLRTDRTNSDITTTTSPTGGPTITIARDVIGTTVDRATGGTVTGTYSGTVGVAAANVFTGQQSVTQTGATASTATVTGTIFGGFTGIAGGTNSDGATTFTSRETMQPNRASTRDTRSTSTSTTTQVASTSSLTVGATGRIADSASSNGFVSLDSAGGNASFALNGGRVDSDVDVTAASGTNGTSTSETTATFTRAPSPSGAFVPELQQLQSDVSTFDERQAPGTASATITGGIIGGDLTVRGNGTGAGTLGASVVMNGNLTGGLFAFATGIDQRNSTSSVATRTGPNAVTRTTVSNTLSSPPANGGGVLVAANGTVGGGLVAGADAGSVTVNLTGSVGSLSPDGALVQSFDFTSARQTTTTAAGTTFFDLVPTASRVDTRGTASGGAATLNVAANADVRAAGTSSIEGDIGVFGFAGSALNVAAGTRIAQTMGQISVGTAFVNSTGTTNTTFAANGAQTGSSGTSVGTIVGGPTSLTNAGIIGSTNNLVAIDLFGVGNVTATNTGTINGSITATSQSGNRSTTTTTTDTNIPALRRTVTTTNFTAFGGAARVDNASLITGNITASGATGVVNNSGVIRGAVTLGDNSQNFTRTTTTTTVAGRPVTTTGPVSANVALFAQNYTLNQNGLLLGGVDVAGVTSMDPAGGSVRTGTVTAAVNLNNGSITLGNITAAPNAAANVNLNGSGFLGVAANDATGPLVIGQTVTGFTSTPSLTRFTAIDPTLGTTTPLPSGTRISGVQTVTKAGDGTFVIVGAPLLPATSPSLPTYTVDVGTLRVNGGELQLGVANPTTNANAFGIRGNVENNASLVVGRRITNGTQTAVQGINLSVAGNVTNAAAGNLIVGVNPTFIRAAAPAPGTNPFAGTPAPFVAFGPTAPGLASTSSFVRVDGNLNLAGNVSVQAGTGGLFEAGRAYDLFNVGGTYANTGTVRSSFASPFVGFTLTPRSEGGRTIVSLNVVRNNFDTVTTDGNSAAAAGALQGALPGIFAGIRSGSANANTQDLANIVAALDTQLTRDQSAQLFRELGSGSFYGSLSAVSTTIPFGEATDGLSPTASGIGLWFRPTGQFAKYKNDDRSGASEINVSNYGGSIGLNYATGRGGNIGIAGGYGRLDVDATTPETAEADTYMIGVYGSQQLGGLHLSGQFVYGQSKWTASRDLTLLGRRATASFDSKELRGSLRAAYTLVPLPGLDISPFAKIEARRYAFDGFTEAGAGAVALTVQGRRRTVISPELGLRMSGALGATLRPFAEGSYIFQNDVRSDRLVNFVGAQAQSFTLEGVDPGRSIKAAIGVVADVGAGTIFVRGDYASGGQQQVGTVRGGLLFNF